MTVRSLSHFLVVFFQCIFFESLGNENTLKHSEATNIHKKSYLIKEIPTVKLNCCLTVLKTFKCFNVYPFFPMYIKRYQHILLQTTSPQNVSSVIVEKNDQKLLRHNIWSTWVGTKGIVIKTLVYTCFVLTSVLVQNVVMF